MQIPNPDRPLRIFTWHIHGSYLYYLVQSPHEFYVPTKPGRPEGYGGRAGSFPWPGNLHEVQAGDVKEYEFDIILFQSHKNYLQDQYEILSESQQQLPRIFLEHDPPRQHPTDSSHPVDDSNVLLVHVTHFNRLMWDNGRTPTMVIEHGVLIPEGVRYKGEIRRGLVVVNGLESRGRRLGADIFEKVRQYVPLDLVGLQAEQLGGLGAIPNDELPAFEAHYRFFFNPIRYTSLGLAVCEAMMVGMPIVGLATTEMVNTIQNGISGFIDTDVDRLIDCMQDLLDNPDEARRLGEGAHRYARECFNINRFASDWDEAFRLVSGVTPMVHLSVKKDAISVENGSRGGGR
jgi:glycosyltransferase involved in cell wall biosynthesis